MIVGPQDEVLIDVIDDRHEVLVPAGIQGLADGPTSIHLTGSQLELDVGITGACRSVRSWKGRKVNDTGENKWSLESETG